MNSNFTVSSWILYVSFFFLTTSSVVMGYGNSFGKIFRVTTFGESHGKAVGVVVDGCPPRIPFDLEVIQRDLDRRKPGQSKLTSPRKEEDRIEILSGVDNGLTTGTPVSFLVWNKDQKSSDYDEMLDKYRPSHADATYDAKYGLRSAAGGGRASARETIARVAAGSVAKLVLQHYCDLQVIGYVKSVQDIVAEIDTNSVSTEAVESNMMRCPDETTAKLMIARVDEIRKTGDSIGGVVELVVKNVPAGLGGPVFDKLEAELAKACLSIPAAKGFEIGSGFAGTLLTGKQHNDLLYVENNSRIRTTTNRSGGIQGGISNGEDIVLRVAFKPTATISQVQTTVTNQGKETTIRGKGRHDPCVLPRAVPIVESMVTMVLLDSLMCHVGQCELFPRQESFKSKLGKNIKSPIPL